MMGIATHEETSRNILMERDIHDWRRDIWISPGWPSSVSMSFPIAQDPKSITKNPFHGLLKIAFWP
jgi:hypothetical protein